MKKYPTVGQLRMLKDAVDVLKAIGEKKSYEVMKYDVMRIEREYQKNLEIKLKEKEAKRIRIAAQRSKMNIYYERANKLRAIEK
jgi:hypothetical protein